MRLLTVMRLAIELFYVCCCLGWEDNPLMEVLICFIYMHKGKQEISSSSSSDISDPLLDIWISHLRLDALAIYFTPCCRLSIVWVGGLGLNDPVSTHPLYVPSSTPLLPVISTTTSSSCNVRWIHSLVLRSRKVSADLAFRHIVLEPYVNR